MASYFCVLCGRFWPQRDHECDHAAEQTQDHHPEEPR